MKPYTADEIQFLVKTCSKSSELMIFWQDLKRCQDHYINEVWINIIELFQTRNKQFI